MSHDAIVVGGGHNGLTCAAYLAHAAACGHNAAQRVLKDRKRQRFTRKLVRASRA